MSKKFSIFLSALFCTFIGGVAVISLLLPDKDFSPLENRYLQDPPRLSLENLNSGKFMEDAEDYVSDHIVGRDFWVAAKAWSERLSGKKESNGVYFGAQDTLINRVDTPSQAKLDKDMGYLDTLVGNVSAPVYFGLIPSAAEIWRDRRGSAHGGREGGDRPALFLHRGLRHRPVWGSGTPQRRGPLLPHRPPLDQPGGLLRGQRHL